MDALDTVRRFNMVSWGIESETCKAVQALPVAGRRIAPAPPGICLAGCGSWGRVHALELKGLGSRVRRFFASRDLGKARFFAQRFDGEDVFCGLDAALADPRVAAVVLALPHHLHADAARAALEAGKHVLVEKPLATGVDEARGLLALAEQEHLCLAVAEQYRLSPLSLAARDLIKQGLLGRIGLVRTSVLTMYRPQERWKTERASTGGGVLLDSGIHYIDLLRTWFGEPEVVAASSPPPFDSCTGGEDCAIALLRFPAGPVASVHVSWSAVSPPKTPNVEVIGKLGALELWYSRPYLRLTTELPPERWSERLCRRLPWRVRRRIDGLFPGTRSRRVRVQNTDLLGIRALLEDFVAAVTSGREPAVPGREGLRDLEIVLAAYGTSGIERRRVIGQPYLS
jgi:predicted dehydrogenase